MYEKLRAEPRTVVQRSPIHNLGLFCTRDINQHDMVIEYMGELVRPVVSSFACMWEAMGCEISVGCR